MWRRRAVRLTPKTKEGASMLIGLLTAIVVGGILSIFCVSVWLTIAITLVLFGVVSTVAFFTLRNYIAHKLQPIYSIVLARDVHAKEVLSEMKFKQVENIREELEDWAEDNDREIARLKESNAFRKQYLGNVAHELKTPIFNIQGYISTLLDGGLEDETINYKYLEQAEKSTDRLINIVNDLDTISKLESNMTRLNIEPFDIAALAKEIADNCEMEAEKKGISITVAASEELPSPYWVMADKHFIGQVFVNLIMNSIRYGSEGGQTQVRFTSRGEKVKVEVEDNGWGIAKEDQPRIFERFYRADKARSRKEGGTGLGLAIVKHITEAHSARIKVQSELGKGSTFSFKLKAYNKQNIKS